MAKAVFLAWNIWKPRNVLVFENTKWWFEPSVHGQNSSRQSVQYQGFVFLWPLRPAGIPPSPGSLKINCDAPWTPLPVAFRGWGGIILRDSYGRVIDGRRFQISA